MKKQFKYPQLRLGILTGGDILTMSQGGGETPLDPGAPARQGTPTAPAAPTTVTIPFPKVMRN